MPRKQTTKKKKSKRIYVIIDAEIQKWLDALPGYFNKSEYIRGLMKKDIAEKRQQQKEDKKHGKTDIFTDK